MPDYQTIGATVKGSALDAGTPLPMGDDSLIVNALNASPGITESAGFSMYRGSQTILHGGWGAATDNNFFRTTLNRRSLTRLPHVNAFGQGGYTPFNFASFMSNRASNLADRSQWFSGKMAGWTGSRGTFTAGEAGTTVAWGGGGTPFMTNGLLSQLSAAQRVGRMGTISADLASNLNAWRGVVLGGKAPVMGSFNAGMTGNMAANRIAATGGVVNQAVGGALRGAAYGSDVALAGTKGMERQIYSRAAGWAGRTFGDDAIRLGVRQAGRAAAADLAGGAARRAAIRAGAAQAGKMGVRFGARLALAASNPIVGAALTAWMVYDLAKVGVGLIRDGIIRPTVQLYKDARKSFMGQINKPVMGMGFVDNEVAATSRARGVAAIQNSRMNARSILGNEAGMMSAHFG